MDVEMHSTPRFVCVIEYLDPQCLIKKIKYRRSHCFYRYCGFSQGMASHMKKITIEKPTTLSDTPQKIVQHIEKTLSCTLGDAHQSHYDAVRGWQIAGVWKNKNYRVDCHEDQNKIYIYL